MFGGCQPLACNRVPLVGLLLMERPSVIHRRRNAAFVEIAEPTGPARHPHGVLRPYRGRPVDYAWTLHIGRQQFLVPCSNTVPGIDLVHENGELLKKDRCLKRIEASVHSDANIVVLILALSVYTQRPNDLCGLAITRENGATIPVTAQGLGREEARGRDVADRPDLPASIGRAECLGGIADQPEIVLPGEALDGVVVTRLAEQVDADDATHRQPQPV